MTTTIEAKEANKQLPALLKLAKAGNDVIILEDTVPIARLSAVKPLTAAPRLRVAGLHNGAITVSDDFDQPLSDEFWIGQS